MDKLVYISIVLAFLTGIGLSSMYFSDLQPEVTINRTEGDQITKVEPPRYNYIQANYPGVNYSYEDGGILVEDLDEVITVYGSSMRPTMFTGHKALAVNYEGQSLEEGDIISTESGILHRIEANYVRTSGYYRVRGDNNERAEQVEPEEIDAVVVGVLYTENRD